MRIDGKPWRSIWLEHDGRTVGVIDQTVLPWRFATRALRSLEDAAEAIRTMVVRGAPLIGATGAYGMALAMAEDPSDTSVVRAYAELLETRPTAVNLRWALDRCKSVLNDVAPADRAERAYAEAFALCEEDVAQNEAIGRHGLSLLQQLWAQRRQQGATRLNVLTHCNAGWIATVDWGTALAPLYMAHDAGIPVHVWVDETRPRNQGAALTAWELGSHGVPHTVIVDNAGGLLMQQGSVDLCLVGTDRVTAAGDVCNKIGTYLKALASHDNGVPFYVALPGPTIDWSLRDGRAIPIEERAAEEVLFVTGQAAEPLRVVAPGSAAANPAFDVTPARLVTGFVTERGLCPAREEGLRGLYPEAPKTLPEATHQAG